MRLHCLYAALVLTLAFASPALAYLDPGTGSMLVSALVGIVATLFFLLKGIYYKGTGFFYRPDKTPGEGGDRFLVRRPQLLEQFSPGDGSPERAGRTLHLSEFG